MLQIHGTDLTSESEGEANDDDDGEVTDEDDWIQQQRVNSKLNNILKKCLPL